MVLQPAHRELFQPDGFRPDDPLRRIDAIAEQEDDESPEPDLKHQDLGRQAGTVYNPFEWNAAERPLVNARYQDKSQPVESLPEPHGRVGEWQGRQLMADV